MQPTSGGGLARFHSAPASWLESVLLKEEEDENEQGQYQDQDQDQDQDPDPDPDPDPLSFTQLLSTIDAPPSRSQLFEIGEDYPMPNSLDPNSVPFRVRAKRGCATHPRSIAERVRRTRISDRIRKLQELVPNMDKNIEGAGTDNYK